MPGKAILIVVNRSKPGASEQVEELRPWFEQRGQVVGVIDTLVGRPAETVRADLCVVFGGDGTLLAAARHLAPSGVPMMGVNMGKLGFLADFNVEHMKKHMDDILAGRVRPMERIMLEVRAEGPAGQPQSWLVANDVAVTAGEPFRMIELHVACDGDEIASYLGDGLVVSTPTGSTGYNLSAGGPILEPAMDAMVITPVAPHSLSMRPIVVGGKARVRISAHRLNRGTTLVIDGQVSTPLREGQSIEVGRAPCVARIVPHPGRTFFDRLTAKLHWGRSPHHP